MLDTVILQLMHSLAMDNKVLVLAVCKPPRAKFGFSSFYSPLDLL